MDLLRKLSRHAAADWVALGAALPLVSAVRPIVRLAPYRWWRRAMSSGAAAPSVRRTGWRWLTPARIGWAVETASRMVPDATCLTQAITANLLLRLAGHPSTVTLGVRKTEHGPIEAHAWVESQGQPIVGVRPDETFKPLRPPPSAPAVAVTPRAAMAAVLDALADAPTTRGELTEPVQAAALTHRVSGLLGADPIEDGFPAPSIYGLQLTSTLLDVIDRFDREGIRVIALKGPALSLLLHGDVSIRRSRDVDLLVPAASLGQARDVLRAAGYSDITASRPSPTIAFNSRWGCEWIFQFAASEPAVEVHWRIATAEMAFDPEFDALWQRREEITVGGRVVAVLGREDLLLYLSVHGAKHLWCKLLWLSDLATLVRVTPELDWDAVIDRSRMLGCRRRVALGLSLVQWCLGIALPEHVGAWVRRERTARAVGRLLERRLRAGSGCLDPGYANDALQVLLVDAPEDRARYGAFVRDRAVFAMTHGRRSPIRALSALAGR